MRLPFVSAALLLTAVGCALEEPATSEADEDLLSANLLSANLLSANLLSANLLSANMLAANSLSVQNMVNTANGRLILKYVVSCALPASATMTAKDSAGTTWSFAGSIGLAPEWATGVPTASNRRWVSACVLARTNYFGISVPISMRADNNIHLTATSSEITTYNEAEGAFWGDLFGSSTAIYEYTCAAQAFSTGTNQGIEGLRDCSRPGISGKSMCGFTFAGYCPTNYPGMTAACTDKVAPYGSCTAPGAVGYAEVITIYLQH